MKIKVFFGEFQDKSNSKQAWYWLKPIKK
jgi:hypothetical protein